LRTSAHEAGRQSRADYPLIIAIHGGTYTSKYFDVPGYSVLDRAAALGIPIIAVDRPGYGESSPLPAGEATIARNAQVLEEAIGQIWGTHASGARGIVLIGHSIGGAVTVAIAAHRPSWPLLGVSISGIGLRSPPEVGEAWANLPALSMIDLPLSIKDAVMFGPAWTLEPTQPAASYVANALVPRAELIDIVMGWPEHVRALAAKVTVPVHYRQAEFEKLWIMDAENVTSFGAAFSASAAVSAQMFSSVGHCIDFHRLGAAFQLEQLAFALRCALKAP
jgi:pimeloyl-ACP methyl ester carboxylesterase